MKTKFILIFLLYGFGCTSKRSHIVSDAFGFVPNSIEEAEANGFLQGELAELPDIPKPKEISSMYYLKSSDTLVQLYFDGERLKSKSIVFPKEIFDSTVLFANLRKLGSLMPHTNIQVPQLSHVFKKDDAVYFVAGTHKMFILSQMPGMGKLSTSTESIVEANKVK